MSSVKHICTISYNWSGWDSRQCLWYLPSLSWSLYHTHTHSSITTVPRLWWKLAMIIWKLPEKVIMQNFPPLASWTDLYVQHLQAFLKTKISCHEVDKRVNLCLKMKHNRCEHTEFEHEWTWMKSNVIIVKHGQGLNGYKMFSKLSIICWHNSTEMGSNTGWMRKRGIDRSLWKCSEQWTDGVLKWHSRLGAPRRRPNFGAGPDSWLGWVSPLGASSGGWWGSSSCPGPGGAPGAHHGSCPQSEPPMSTGSHRQASTWPGSKKAKEREDNRRLRITDYFTSWYYSKTEIVNYSAMRAKCKQLISSWKLHLQKLLFTLKWVF